MRRLLPLAPSVRLRHPLRLHLSVRLLRLCHPFPLRLSVRLRHLCHPFPLRLLVRLLRLCRRLQPHLLALLHHLHQLFQLLLWVQLLHSLRLPRLLLLLRLLHLLPSAPLRRWNPVSLVRLARPEDRPRPARLLGLSLPELPVFPARPECPAHPVGRLHPAVRSDRLHQPCRSGPALPVHPSVQSESRPADRLIPSAPLRRLVQSSSSKVYNKPSAACNHSHCPMTTCCRSRSSSPHTFRYNSHNSYQLTKPFLMYSIHHMACASNCERHPVRYLFSGKQIRAALHSPYLRRRMNEKRVPYMSTFFVSKKPVPCKCPIQAHTQA